MAKAPDSDSGFWGFDSLQVYASSPHLGTRGGGDLLLVHWLRSTMAVHHLVKVEGEGSNPFVAA